VQSEFSVERIVLKEYINTDTLLGKFFEPFLFEELPAVDKRSDHLYLKAVEACDLYLGIFGKIYGNENEMGLAPTEIEFDHATVFQKTRLVFLSSHSPEERHPKENILVQKAQAVLVRKKFQNIHELKSAVYASLIRYLEEKRIILTSPFDTTLNFDAQIKDIDGVKLKSFIRLAKEKKGFPIPESESPENVLMHLNLMRNRKLTNAGLLLFAKYPQRFFINSEVRCASFSGLIIEKPIPSYKVFKGTIFELVDQALEFVLNKLDYRIETRAERISIPGSYEIPKEAVAEALVNAIIHRDYTSNGSVQVLIFRNRIEIWNPGSLPMGWTTEKLKQPHPSIPANPFLAEPMYLAGYIERLGTGTSDLVNKCISSGLFEPQFIQQDEFRVVIYRTGIEQVPNKYRTGTEQLSNQVKNLLLVLTKESSRQELMIALKIRHRPTFLYKYLNPAIRGGWIEMSHPQEPNTPNQKYRLTVRGRILQENLRFI